MGITFGKKNTCLRVTVGLRRGYKDVGGWSILSLNSRHWATRIKKKKVEIDPRARQDQGGSGSRKGLS